MTKTDVQIFQFARTAKRPITIQDVLNTALSNSAEYISKSLGRLTANGYLACSHPHGQKLNHNSPPRTWVVTPGVHRITVTPRVQSRDRNMSHATPIDHRKIIRTQGTVPATVAEKMDLPGLVAQQMLQSQPVRGQRTPDK